MSLEKDEICLHCSCSECHMHIAYYPEDEPNGYYATMFVYHNWNLWNRVKYCWWLLTKSEVYFNETLLSQKEIESLFYWLKGKVEHG